MFVHCMEKQTKLQNKTNCEYATVRVCMCEREQKRK